MFGTNSVSMPSQNNKFVGDSSQRNTNISNNNRAPYFRDTQPASQFTGISNSNQLNPNGVKIVEVTPPQQQIISASKQKRIRFDEVPIVASHQVQSAATAQQQQQQQQQQQHQEQYRQTAPPSLRSQNTHLYATNSTQNQHQQSSQHQKDPLQAEVDTVFVYQPKFIPSHSVRKTMHLTTDAAAAAIDSELILESNEEKVKRTRPAVAQPLPNRSMQSKKTKIFVGDPSNFSYIKPPAPVKALLRTANVDLHTDYDYGQKKQPKSQQQVALELQQSNLLQPFQVSDNSSESKPQEITLSINAKPSDRKTSRVVSILHKQVNEFYLKFGGDDLEDSARIALLNKHHHAGLKASLKSRVEAQIGLVKRMEIAVNELHRAVQLHENFMRCNEKLDDLSKSNSTNTSQKRSMLSELHEEILQVISTCKSQFLYKFDYDNSKVASQELPGLSKESILTILSDLRIECEEIKDFIETDFHDYAGAAKASANAARKQAADIPETDLSLFVVKVLFSRMLDDISDLIGIELHEFQGALTHLIEIEKEIVQLRTAEDQQFTNALQYTNSFLKFNLISSKIHKYTHFTKLDISTPWYWYNYAQNAEIIIEYSGVISILREDALEEIDSIKQTFDYSKQEGNKSKQQGKADPSKGIYEDLMKRGSSLVGLADSILEVFQLLNTRNGEWDALKRIYEIKREFEKNYGERNLGIEERIAMQKAVEELKGIIVLLKRNDSTIGEKLRCLQSIGNKSFNYTDCTFVSALLNSISTGIQLAESMSELITETFGFGGELNPKVSQKVEEVEAILKQGQALESKLRELQGKEKSQQGSSESLQIGLKQIAAVIEKLGEYVLDYELMNLVPDVMRMKWEAAFSNQKSIHMKYQHEIFLQEFYAAINVQDFLVKLKALDLTKLRLEQELNPNAQFMSYWSNLQTVQGIAVEFKNTSQEINLKYAQASCFFDLVEHCVKQIVAFEEIYVKQQSLQAISPEYSQDRFLGNVIAAGSQQGSYLQSRFQEIQRGCVEFYRYFTDQVAKQQKDLNAQEREGIFKGLVDEKKAIFYGMGDLLIQIYGNSVFIEHPHTRIEDVYARNEVKFGEYQGKIKQLLGKYKNQADVYSFVQGLQQEALQHVQLGNYVIEMKFFIAKLFEEFSVKISGISSLPKSSDEHEKIHYVEPIEALKAFIAEKKIEGIIVKAQNENTILFERIVQKLKPFTQFFAFVEEVRAVTEGFLGAAATSALRRKLDLGNHECIAAIRATVELRSSMESRLMSMKREMMSVGFTNHWNLAVKIMENLKADTERRFAKVNFQFLEHTIKLLNANAYLPTENNYMTVYGYVKRYIQQNMKRQGVKQLMHELYDSFMPSVLTELSNSYANQKNFSVLATEIKKSGMFDELAIVMSYFESFKHENCSAYFDSIWLIIKGYHQAKERKDKHDEILNGMTNAFYKHNSTFQVNFQKELAAIIQSLLKDDFDLNRNFKK